MCHNCLEFDLGAIAGVNKERLGLGTRLREQIGIEIEG
jgi:hypothetical protein